VSPELTVSIWALGVSVVSLVLAMYVDRKVRR